MKEIERLILINQFEILQRLNPEESNYYNEKIEIIREGFEYHYSEIFIELSEPLPAEDSKFVLDILNMYRDINFSKINLINNAENHFESLSTNFRGFDFNDDYESRLGTYARFFIETLDRFKELIEDDSFDSFNSHYPMKDLYQTYLNQYKIVKSSDNYHFGKLNSNQISEILR